MRDNSGYERGTEHTIPIAADAQRRRQTVVPGNIEYVNAKGLPGNPAYSHAVAVSGNVRNVYVGGQNAVDASGQIVGKGDLAAQTEQALKNLQSVLQAAGAELEHVVKWTVYLVQGQSPMEGFEAFRRFWGNRTVAPALTVLFVAGLAHPDFLIEIEAVAAVRES